ncbi:putative RNA recognition motif domain, nucleotide-binding alpha-beta plait domain superfamily [Helianthus annuus]|nr:putative RNA recognition motif domain, nucleotide-binding alpha-beta plait domain superfamily [Helianthus annuus]KAJ0830369.1 putative RNA recognition motif domain, nucleotide-binding alpha-beta plait domain superfamily [Helianthus annuus]
MDFQKDGGEDLDNGGPWQNVQYRKNNRSRGDGVEWTFLVQNISDKVTRNILWRAFQPFGFVSDVYVARKRDSRGRCFGFVRYVGVVNMQETLTSMNTIRLFNMKVIVSLAKYDKDHKKIVYTPDMLGRREWRPKEGQGQQVNSNQFGDSGIAGGTRPMQQTNEQGPKNMQKTYDGRSYADILNGDKSDNNHGAKVITVDGKGSLYPLHCVGRSILGFAKEVMSLSKMRMAIEFEGMSEVGLSFVGGVTYLLTFRDKVTATTCMQSNSQFFNKMFTKFQLWVGDDIPFSRLVSLNITGVPFIIRDNKLFDNIGGLFGEVVQKSSFSWQEEDNSSASVKIITTQASRIDEAVVIKWNNRTLAIWVSEYDGLPVRDDVSILGSQDDHYEDDSDSDMVSDDEEELEDGEIKHGMEEVDNNQDGDPMNVQPDSSPADHGQTVGNQEAVEDKRSSGVNAYGEAQRLHGERLETERDTRNNVSQPPTLENPKIVVGDGPNIARVDSNRNGPIDTGMDNNYIGPNYVAEGLGSMSVANLGKRNREERSPPSIGSTQGPAQRFNNLGNFNCEPLDLNTPIRGSSGNSEEPTSIPDIGEEVSIGTTVNITAEAINLEGDGAGMVDPDLNQVIREERC